MRFVIKVSWIKCIMEIFWKLLFHKSIWKKHFHSLKPLRELLKHTNLLSQLNQKYHRTLSRLMLKKKKSCRWENVKLHVLEKKASQANLCWFSWFLGLWKQIASCSDVDGANNLPRTQPGSISRSNPKAILIICRPRFMVVAPSSPVSSSSFCAMINCVCSFSHQCKVGRRPTERKLMIYIKEDSSGATESLASDQKEFFSAFKLRPSLLIRSAAL